MNAIEVAQNNFNSWNRHDPTQLSPHTLKGEPTAPRARGTILLGKPLETLLNRFGKRFLTHHLR